MIKYCTIPLCPSQDMNHPFLPHIHAVYGTHSMAEERRRERERERERERAPQKFYYSILL
jgi:hypothetical protein